MTDTRPTKFCTNCKHFGGISRCWHRNARVVDPVNGRSLQMEVRKARTEHCKGDWYEDHPPAPRPVRTDPSPEELLKIANDLLCQPIPLIKLFDDRPSIFQRIKRWFK